VDSMLVRPSFFRTLEEPSQETEISLLRRLSNAEQSYEVQFLSATSSLAGSQCFSVLHCHSDFGGLRSERRTRKKQPLPYLQGTVSSTGSRLGYGIVQSQSHVTADGQSDSQSVSLGVEPLLGLMTRFLVLHGDYYGWNSPATSERLIELVVAASRTNK
jgi:hypothetical protein